MAARAKDPHSMDAALEARIVELLGATGGKANLVEECSLKGARVLRQIWQTGEQRRAFVLKRFTPERARIERLAIERWLPVLGMERVAPQLLCALAAPDAEFVWHIYEDLGDSTLDAGVSLEFPAARDRGFLSGMDTAADEARLGAALSSLARLHEASVNGALLGECRYWAGDLGANFLSTSVRDAIAALGALQPARIGLSSAKARTRDALADQLMQLASEIPRRRAEFEAFAGPDCLLHGDFGVSNAIVARSGEAWAVRIIDWDHAGVGPVCYDLSTLLLQLPPSQRQAALGAYCSFRKAPRGGWPSLETWNALFDTAERSRLANSAIWPALWAVDGEKDSAFDDLSAIVSWFETLPPVLQLSEHNALRRRVHERG